MYWTLAFLLLASVSGAPQPRNNIRFGLNERIVGGSDIDISKVPYQISLEYRGSHICGGSIISQNYVVTAAHCTDGSSASTLTVRAGTTKRGSGGEQVNVAQIIQNPDYNANTIDYDISILELSASLPLGTNIAAVGLPTENQSITSGTDVLVTGWGTLSEGGSSLPSNLQGVTVKIVDNNSCNRAYGSGSITARMLCAGVDGGGKDACQGDSGGPLVSGNTLVGIVSWGYGCARASYPGVYSSVPALRKFINTQTGL